MKSNRKSTTVGLYTLGCKVSQYETEAVSEAFSDLGYTVSDFDSVCDVYVINTCTVTAESDRKCRQIIRRAHRKNPRALIAVMGCYSQRSPGEVSRIEGVGIVVGTEGKMTLPKRVDDLLSGIPGEKISVGGLDGATFEPMTVRGTPRTRAYVKIEDGCEAKCSYCAISAARGPVRSKPMDEVIREVEGLAESGVSEIVLTGIETGSWGRDLEGRPDLGDLISELDRRGSCYRIRLGSLAPELVGESFAEKIKGARILAPHFHISLQSGADSVLRAMRRRYTREGALENIRRLKRLIPKAQFTTDLMVGFPGESEEDFLDTVSFVREAPFLDAHVFAYSKREGTPAAAMSGQIPEETKRERSARLIAVKNEVRASILEGLIRCGEPMDCILETHSGGAYSAHTDSFVELLVAGAEGELLPEGLSGARARVVPVSQNNGIVAASLITEM